MLVRIVPFALASLLLLLPLGCGSGSSSASVGNSGNGNSGGSGDTGPVGNLTGIWSGQQQTDTSNSVDYQLTQSGGRVSGVERVTIGNVAYFGPVTGSINGSNFTLATTYTNGFGTETYTGTVSAGQASGNFAFTGSAGKTSGTIYISQSNGLTPNFTGTWNGAAIATSNQAVVSVSFVVTQSGNNLAVKASVGGMTPVSATGVIIGPRATFSVPLSSGVSYSFDGSVAGGSYTGSYAITGQSGGNFDANYQGP